MKKSEAILRELKEHLPFTLLVSLVAGVLVSIFYFMGRVPSEALFEIIHPAHILVSAIATSAIYWKYKKSAWLSLLVGIGGAVLIGSLSDVLLPWLAGQIFSLETSLHLPIMEEPFFIFGLAGFGAVIGMYKDWFKATHLLHVFLSVFASLFYLLAFSTSFSFSGILLISALVFLAVYIPCCISDIVFPLIFIDEPCLDCGHYH